jgi:hypothetical protein
VTEVITFQNMIIISIYSKEMIPACLTPIQVSSIWCETDATGSGNDVVAESVEATMVGCHLTIWITTTIVITPFETTIHYLLYVVIILYGS